MSVQLYTKYVCSIIGITLGLFCNVASSLAQEEMPTNEGQKETSTNASEETKKKGLPGLDELRVPNSPAFNLMEISPSAINRPTTPKAFGLSLLESISESEGDFPRNIALDFAPYWWSPHPDLTFKEYYDKTGFGESVLQTLSLSIGTTEAKVKQDDEQVDGTRVGLGLRFNLISGKANPNLEEKVNEARNLINKCLSPSTLDPKEKVLECIESKKTEFRNTAKEISDLEKTRVGWQLELASATTFDFSENDWDELEFTRFGTWLTTSYRSANTSSALHQLSFLGIGRYIYDDFGGEGDNIFDLGGSIVWQAQEIPLSLSAEYLRRFADEGDDRIVGVAEYRINDTYSLFASYGKTFDDSFSGNDDLVTLFGINVGLGKGPILKAF